MTGLFGGQLYGQIELGLQGGILQPLYRYSCKEKGSVTCEGRVNASLGWSAGLVGVIHEGDTGRSWPIGLELSYTQRKARIHGTNLVKFGVSEFEEEFRYGMVYFGFLPRFAWRGKDPWYGAAGLRLGIPLWAEHSVEKWSSGVYPVAHQTDTAYFESNATGSLSPIDLRIVLLLGFRPGLGHGDRFVLEATVDHGVTALIDNSSNASISSTDLGLRVGYYFNLGAGRPAD
ncbi:MAG: outer membrane beta-barrel protein [Flavobacteriales bacterium]|nr:outer membrane beta-barrel protein [Flavobacteriales bacterium]